MRKKEKGDGNPTFDTKMREYNAETWDKMAGDGDPTFDTKMGEYKLCTCAGGAPPIFCACGRGLLLKLATFDRSVTEAKQHLLSIT